MNVSWENIIERQFRQAKLRIVRYLKLEPIQSNPSLEQIIETQKKLVSMQKQQWINHDIFSLQFWLLMFLMIVPWLIWWKITKKSRLCEILLYGMVVLTIVTTLDEFGCQLILWEYAYDVEPLFPRLIPINFSVLPVAYMIIYQYFETWRSYLTANIIMAALFSFVNPFLFG